MGCRRFCDTNARGRHNPDALPPAPPGYGEVVDTIRRHAPVPIPRFAPPVEIGGGVAAVLGSGCM
jgi:hypothetical protein